MSEKWKAVVGYEGFYEVSNAGRIRSIDHFDVEGRLRQGKIRKVSIDTFGAGYRYVSLSKLGAVKKFNVHVLVLEAFVGARPSPLHQCCHGDGDRTNASLTNLRWDTAKANQSDRWLHGTQCVGDGSGRAILTSEMVGWIMGSSQSSLELAPIFGVASSTIRAVRTRQNWRHLA